MNYLAHLFLSGRDEALLLGNFIGDLVSSKELKQLAPTIQAGVQLHRKLDHFTDNHPEFRKGVARLRQDHSKYAPVVLDILYDHLLANDWERFSKQSLQEYSHWVYDVFDSHEHELSAKADRHVKALVHYKYLESYGTLKGIDYTLKRMDARAKFPSNFGQARHHLYRDMALFRNEFLIFFHDIVKYTEVQINQL